MKTRIALATLMVLLALLLASPFIQKPGHLPTGITRPGHPPVTITRPLGGSVADDIQKPGHDPVAIQRPFGSTGDGKFV